MSRRALAGRRALAAELRSTWHVWDASRPLTRNDFAASVRAVDGTAATSPPDGPVVESAAPTDVACVQCARAREVRRLIAR